MIDGDGVAKALDDIDETDIDSGHGLRTPGAEGSDPVGTGDGPAGRPTHRRGRPEARTGWPDGRPRRNGCQRMGPRAEFVAIVRSDVRISHPPARRGSALDYDRAIAARGMGGPAEREGYDAATPERINRPIPPRIIDASNKESSQWKPAIQW